MLAAPTSESKGQSDTTRTSRAPEPERVLHPHVSTACGLENLGRPTLPCGALRLRQQVAGLHRTIGNQAVLRMLSRPAPAIQTKLTVNRPGDEYEQEADQVADQVMRMPDSELAPGSISKEAPSVRRKCACGGSGGECSCKDKQEEGPLQRKAQANNNDSSMPSGGAAPPIVHEVLRSPGQPLDPATRAFFEPRFGYDFRGVRVSSDERSAAAAQAIRAKAFTYGNHIVFGRNEYNTHTAAGLGLIAHELAHTAQQRAAAPSLQTSLAVGALDDPQERSADAVAGSVLGAGRAPSVTADTAVVRRQAQDANYKWDWKGDEEGVYTSSANEKYTVKRVFDPTKTTPTTVDPGLVFARGYVTVKWCKKTIKGRAEAGIDVTNQIQQLVPQMLSTGNPAQVLRQANLTPYVDLVVMKSEKGTYQFHVEADVGQQGVTAVRGGVKVDTPIGKVDVGVGVDLPQGGHPVPTVHATVTPQGEPPKYKCEETTSHFECTKEETVPAFKAPFAITLTAPPRTRTIYFDYAHPIVTTPKTPYGKAHPGIVARNTDNFKSIQQDIRDGYRISAIEGFTSPEGPMPKGQGGFEGNKVLAKERADAAFDAIAGGYCAILRDEVCFTPSKDKVPRVGNGELYTEVKDGKEVEGKELAEHAVPAFEESEGSTLTDQERESLAKSRGALAKSEIIYPLLRRAQITLVKGPFQAQFDVSLPETTTASTVDCPADVKQAANAEFEKKDKVNGVQNR